MNINSNIIIVGIAGCSRSGKTVLVDHLINQYKNIIKYNNSSLFTDIYDVIQLDSYANYNKVMKNKFKTSKGNIYGNWEFIGSIDWDIFYNNILAKIQSLNKKIKNSASLNKKGILFIEGFLLFSPLMSNKNNEINYLKLFDYYIYICLEKKLAKIRRMKTTTVPDDYYEEILWPEHINNCWTYHDFLSNQKYKYKKEVLIIDGNKEYNPKSMALCILKWIGVFNDNNNNIIDYKVYNDMFVSFNKQIDLIKKNFA